MSIIMKITQKKETIYELDDDLIETMINDSDDYEYEGESIKEFLESSPGYVLDFVDWQNAISEKHKIEGKVL